MKQLSFAADNDFNSIKVQLKPHTIIDCSAGEGNFNSIKVQLKLERKSPLQGVGGFQFHKGTIKTCPSGLDDFTTQISIP